MNIQQWPSYQQALYKRTQNANFKIRQSMTDEQKEKYFNLWMTQTDIAAELSYNNWPDGLIETVAENRTLKLAVK